MKIILKLKYKMKRQLDDFFSNSISPWPHRSDLQKSAKNWLKLKKLIVEAGNGSSNKTVNALFLTSIITALLLKMFSLGVNVPK